MLVTKVEKYAKVILRASYSSLIKVTGCANLSPGNLQGVQARL